MQYIKKVEIQYFRSIYRQTITNISHLNIITGKNDAGKSNILKALNLFFNKQTDANTDFNFKNDFNFRRLNEVRKDSIKGKQFIQIKITFCRGKQYEKSLPSYFTVTKKWLRNDVSDPSIFTDDVELQLKKEGKKYSDRSKSSLTKFLNNITYLYIPAVKDEKTFEFALTQLQSCIYDKKLSENTNLQKSLNIIADSMSASVSEINDEFSSVTGILSSVNPPRNIMTLYNKSINVFTKYGENDIEIGKRGDGIRVRYIPSILNYIAKSSKTMCIWGFEEPENSLEYALTLSMAETFCKDYIKNSMIFVTSHSPAFIGLDSEKNVSLYRCFNRYNDNSLGTEIVQNSEIINRSKNLPNIEEELGYIQLQKELYEKYSQAVTLQKKQNEMLSKLNNEIIEIKRPVVITEGKTDVLILKEAWKKLYSSDCPYDIKSCDITDDSTNSTAGCDMLAKYLESYRYDSPNIVIGLFDCDEAGKQAYMLNKNYVSEAKNRWKASKNGKAFAMLLPVPIGKENFDSNNNLCIEFYFEKTDLEAKVDGICLGLVPQKIRTMCGNMTIEERFATELHFHSVKENKEFFASKIVPTFPKESFTNFIILFDQIKEIIDTNSTEVANYDK